MPRRPVRKEAASPDAAGLTITAGGAVLARLKTLGVDYIFANSGTDFPPIIEGLAEAAAKDIALPRAIVIPHEHAAMGMAHGYYLATGRAQAVMAHTNVGLANCAIGAINAAIENVPVILFSGRTPVLEQGRLGARSVPIGWGQEMRDQAALVREASKWDYELRFPEQAVELVDRAYAIAGSTPKGPVYLSLPREVLCEPAPAGQLAQPPRMHAFGAAPRPEALDEAAALIAAARRPLIIAQRGAGSAESFAVLSELALDWGIPVCQYWAVQLAIPGDHPMYVGVDPAPWLKDADCVLVLDSIAPWSPNGHALPPDCKVIQVGQDPLAARTPIRNFAADVALVGDTAAILPELARRLALHLNATATQRETRRKTVSEAHAARRASVKAQAERGDGDLMTKDFVSLTLSAEIAAREVTVLSELGAPLEPMTLRQHQSWYQEPHAGGLGWSFPCALGLKLARPDRLVIATMGDGSYMFSNPVACHQIAEALGLSVLVLILNNSEWGAVRRSVLDVYPDGFASKTNTMPLVSLDPSPDFVKVAEASRAHARRVEKGSELAGALREAIAHVSAGKGCALLDIRVAP
jgi:acetolactate synthase-1/2/3 large subunit